MDPAELAETVAGYLHNRDDVAEAHPEIAETVRVRVTTQGGSVFELVVLELGEEAASV